VAVGAVPSARAPAQKGFDFNHSAGTGSAAGSDGTAGTGAGGKLVGSGQQLIYTAQLSVRAANVDAAVSRATLAVTAAGGYISSENATDSANPSQASTTVTYKIPAAAYGTTLAALSGKALGTQLSLTEQAQDVTQQVADVNSQVASDQAAIAQLRTLLKHAGSVGDLLTVQDQINSEESGLESMLAQQSALDHETAYATLTVTVVGPKAAPKPAAKPAPPAGLSGGLAHGWHALHLTISWLLTVIGTVAPFALALIVLGGIGWLVRHLRRRGTAGQSGAGQSGAGGDS
jgi:hypothetical protein